ncbi:WXG100 family type VII secretion target [Mycobacterium shimoidei]|uniref:WXG100 family type VII secretion target n=1 Tax=Mycobacterium shimoidei TaxID=29313 RepID=UPI0008489FF4|nr:WXG100 family type VII secretion target [Mycobacterium shimoidei]MCV7259310.1 WXG100 family type VII secretion target [Mycobacterium shimoidei]ODR13361.1 hypothetical protein BHQ16_11530 [Mycobacterium shimoidei]ORW79700.1 hypothetical protein AWC26_14935 [Mycobacterium shimoidei]
MADLRVATGAVVGAATSIEEAAASLGEFGTICAAADEVIGGSWTGQAADGIRASWTKWSEGFQDVISGLHREADALRSAASAYTSTDNDAESALAAQMRMGI